MFKLRQIFQCVSSVNFGMQMLQDLINRSYSNKNSSNPELVTDHS